MGQGSTENHSRTAKRPVLIPPRRAHLRCPPLPLQRAAEGNPHPRRLRVPFLPGAGIICPRAGCPISARGRNAPVSALFGSPPSGFRFVPPIPFAVPLSSRSVPLSGRFRLSGRGLLAACRHSASALLLEPRRIGSFLFEHWWGIIKITIQVSVLEGGKREKCFIGNGFMILFSSFPAAARLDEGL